MKASTAGAVALAVQMRRPVILWGMPGTGKTSFVYKLGEALGLYVKTHIASIHDPVDYSGYVSVQGVVGPDGRRRAEVLPPPWVEEILSHPEGVIWFLDELSTAPPAVQAALLRPILERVVGDTPLPQNTSIIAAANPPEVAAGGWDLEPPTANRFVHLEWTVDTEAYIEGSLRGWPMPPIPRLPENWKELYLPEMTALVTAYLRRNPAKLFVLPKEESERGRAWPSPRTWHFATEALAAVKASHASPEVEMELVSGSIGATAAQEFFVWRRELDLPDPEWMLKHPKEFTLPDRGDKVLVVLGAVASAVLSHPTQERWTAGWDLMVKALEDGAGGQAAVAVRSLASYWLRHKSDLPLPREQARAFIPILTEAGISLG